MEAEFPMWHNPECSPPDELGAQAVFIQGQWKFIPFAFGIPLSKSCSTCEQALGEANAVENELIDALKEIGMAAQNRSQTVAAELEKIRKLMFLKCLKGEAHRHNSKIPEEFSIYRLIEMQENYIVIYPDGMVSKEPVEGYESAIGVAVRFAETLSNSEISGRKFP
jgi:hypothetical protein